MRTQTIIGYRKNGAPIWNIMGGAPYSDAETIPTLADLRNKHDGEELYEAARNALEEHRGAMEEIDSEAAGKDLTATQARRWKEHESAEGELRKFVQNQRAERARAHRQRYGVGLGGYQPAVPVGGQVRDAAMRTIEGEMNAGRLPTHAADKVDELVSRSRSDGERTLAARWAVAAGDPAYLGAFAKRLADPHSGHLLWTPEEHAAHQRVASVQAELRAMSLSPDSAGGFMVPLTLDPAIMLTSDGAINPLRQIARVVQTVTDSWQGVSSAGATAEWKAEGATVADGSPTLDDEPIPVHFGDVFVPYSFEVGMDATNFLAELQRIMADAAANLQVAAFTTGTGSGQPTGFVTSIVADAGSVVTSATTDVFAAEDVYALQNQLPPRFQGRARWGGNVAILNDIAQFETTNGARLFPEITMNPPMLLRKPAHEISDMDGTVDATEENYVLAYGDWMSGFVIVDRIGTTIEPIPNLFDPTTGRPTGERGAFLWFRTGSDVVVPEAFRLLNVT